MTNEKKYYYKIYYLSYHWLGQIINLPKGFTVEQTDYNDSSRLAYMLRIRCPEESQYEINPQREIPEIWDCTLHINDYGVVDKIWWPSLGQEEPTDKENKYINNLEASFRALMNKYRPTVDADLYMQDIKWNTLNGLDVSEAS